MDHRDVRRRKTHARVVLLDVLVVPLLDLAEEDVSNDFRRKVQRLGDRRDIVADNDRAQHCRNVEELTWRCLQLFIFHWSVRSAEVHRLGLNLLDAATRADRLVIDADIRMKLEELKTAPGELL